MVLDHELNLTGEYFSVVLKGIFWVIIFMRLNFVRICFVTIIIVFVQLGCHIYVERIGEGVLHLCCDSGIRYTN